MARNFDIALNDALLAFVNHLAIALPFISKALEFVLGSERGAVEN
jgi:hypothetical protein